MERTSVTPASSITREVIDADLALSANATPAPWTAEYWCDGSEGGVDVSPSHYVDLKGGDGDLDDFIDLSEADAAFIARAREALPLYAATLVRVMDLCDELERVGGPAGMQAQFYAARIRAAVERRA